MLGYDAKLKGYRILSTNENKVIISRDAKFLVTPETHNEKEENPLIEIE